MTGSRRIDGPALPDDILRGAEAAVVWVIGDIMLDEYAVGQVDRISPEAPVPVLRVAHLTRHLGGAANVAMQSAALGARVCLAGTVGCDTAGSEVLRLCADATINVCGVCQLPARPTTRKLRALARSQQLVRLDWEDSSPCAAADIQQMLKQLQRTARPAVIVLSDYAKGVLTDDALRTIADIATRTGAQVVVDPKRRDFGAYPPRSVITPNLRELEAAANRTLAPDDVDAIHDAARAVAAQADARAIIVTRSEHGVLVVPDHGASRAIPARGRALADTTGAGDTVVGVLAVALAAGASLEDAAHMANLAAGIAVGRVGTSTVTRADILLHAQRVGARKVLNRDELAQRVREWRCDGKRIVLTNGCFDLLHAGHLSLLGQAAQYGDVLIVAINSDASIHRLKGPQRPIVSAAERAALLAALECVDAVTLFEEDTPLALLEDVRPDVLVKGEDYQRREIVGRELVESAGGVVMRVPMVADHSTTALVDKIAAARGAPPRRSPPGAEPRAGSNTDEHLPCSPHR